MTDQTDFIALYRELAIDPDGSLDSFKQAYRRRVSELHPDRHGGDDEATAALTRLNLRYAAALAFFQQHGRLPGAPAATSPTAAVRRRRPLRTVASDSDGAASSAGNGGALRRWLLTVLVAVGALWMFLPDTAFDEGDYTSGVVAPPRAPTPGTGVDAGPLRLGMPPAAVLATQGEPDGVEGWRWLYGPSWIRFECNAVIDWYSSRLRPLDAASPQPGAAERSAAGSPRPCPPSAPPDPRQWRS